MFNYSECMASHAHAKEPCAFAHVHILRAARLFYIARVFSKDQVRLHLSMRSAVRMQAGPSYTNLEFV
jgi:hypothetical protein